MNCLFTVNVNNFMVDKSRQSYLAACQRWACDYVEITSGKFCDIMPMAQKYFGCLRLNSYQKVCYIDADCLISADCPSPFELDNHIGHKIYVVQDVPSECWFSKVYHEPMAALEDRLFRLPESLSWIGLNSLRWGGGMTDYFNNGLFVCSPKSDIFSVMATAFEYGIIQRHQEEQALFNMLVYSRIWLEPFFLPRRWNWLEIPLNENKEAFIRHFAGSSIEDKRKLITEA